MPKQPKETDLLGLKSLARALLMLDIERTQMSPLVVKHPFTDSGIVGIKDENGSLAAVNLLDDPGALRRWRALLHQQIDKAEKPFELLLMITKPYKLAFLKHAAPDLSKQDLALFLSYAWTTTEAPNSDPNLNQKALLSMFRSVEPQMLMDDEEYALFQELDDVVTVYRRVTSYNAKNVKALSWTLDRDVAEWFAHRYGEDGTVYEAQISKEHILAVFAGRNESEVIVQAFEDDAVQDGAENISDDGGAPKQHYEKTAAQSNAQFHDPTILLAATRLLRHMANIFRDNAQPPANPAGLRIDSKRRRKLMRKRLAMGHQPDDHADPELKQ